MGMLRISDLVPSISKSIQGYGPLGLTHKMSRTPSALENRFPAVNDTGAVCSVPAAPPFTVLVLVAKGIRKTRAVAIAV